VVKRLLTDNSTPYRVTGLRTLVRRLAVQVERWTGSALRECLYLEVFHSADQRRRGLDTWIDHYSRERPHLALNASPPLVGLQQAVAAS